jgi:hypothetical protein
MSSVERVFFRIHPIDTVDREQCTTLASISLMIDGSPVWPVRGEDNHGLEWYIDDLLSHFAECWKPLLLRQNLSPTRPAGAPIIPSG